ncbi:hypothetical protein [Halobellus ruber]|uniref:Uncharacterized protein n=1 Tax=Halobellus ruber TaxID=2761102 RepID=A0A7J9SJA0_9EURY|nr:hypothetical protein [Halobellus ruber]MBB6647030.1 hypothetical protein [Halobellus ruber]
MVDVRTLAAAVLGVALGVVCLAAPGTIVRIQTAGRLPRDRYGRYGEDGTGGDGADAGGVPTRWLRLVQVVGVVLLVGGAYFAWTLFAAL